MKTKSIAALTILIVLLLASCQTSGGQPAAGAKTLAGLYTGGMPAASSPGRQFYLTLTAKNEAIFSVDYMNDEDPVVQIGAWALSDDGTLAVDLAAADGEGSGNTLSFAVAEGTLELKDNPDYGSEGLSLKLAADDSLKLVPGSWMWLDTVNGDDTLDQPAIPANFTVQFLEDGTLAARLDCNRGMGAFTASDKSIEISMGPTTLMACPEPGLGTEFAQQLDGAAVFFFKQGQLFLDREADSGTLRFARIK